MQKHFERNSCTNMTDEVSLKKELSLGNDEKQSMIENLGLAFSPSKQSLDTESLDMTRKEIYGICRD